MLFYQIGELFQSYAVGKSRRNISALMDIRPDYANVERNGGIETVDPQEVEIGSIIVVKPGEKVPIDGIVVEGSSSLNTSALTGESAPRFVKEKEEVISGCVNLNQVLRIQTTKAFEESTVSKILDLVENASSRKSKSENFISKFAKYYTPAVCYGALALAILPPLLLYFFNQDPQWNEWIMRALTFLVISCPCALVISIPLSFFAGIGGASKAGVLIKGSNYMETLADTKYVVLDKTGTMSEGVFEVNGVHHAKIEEAKLLEYAAYAEYYSTHPIGESIRLAYGKKIDKSRIKGVEEISGQGIVAKIDDVIVRIGNHKLMEANQIEDIDCHEIGTVVHMALNDEYIGHLLISDRLKKTAKATISALRSIGIQKCIMLTGDRKDVADAIAKELQVDEVYSELLPADKVEQVEALLTHSTKNAKLAFVGDGINDAPVLTRADVGIAMGVLGSDAAIEAADVVLMDDDPLKIVKAIQIAKKTMRIVYQNISFAIGVKLFCLLLGAIGVANMWLAIFADVGVMILAVLNAIRALHIK